MQKKFTALHGMVALVFAIVALFALRGPHAMQPDPAGYADIAPAAGASQLPVGLARTAGAALQKARQWQQDAMLVKVELRNSNAYAPDFQFTSFAAQQALDVTERNGRMTALPSGPTFDSTLTPLPATFIDPQAAIAAARGTGMPASIVAATLHTGLDGVPRWTLQPTAGPGYDINATTGLPLPGRR